MTPKEAFRKVLRHEPVNPVPYSIKFTVEAKEKMVARYGEAFDPVRDTGSYVVASQTNSGWEQVRAETRKLLTNMAPGGGYIISPSHSVSGDVPIENIEAFLETVRAQ